MTKREKEEEVKKKIAIQEHKYRYITSLLLQDVFSPYCTGGTIVGTEYTCGIDVRFTANTINYGDITYDIEVKERNKSEEKMIEYPNSELKKKKYESMCSAHTNTRLIYIQYVNEVAYVYNMDKVNWDNVLKLDWKIKKTEYDDESEYEIVPTFFIPYTQKVNIIDAHKYFDNYYANHQQG